MWPVAVIVFVVFGGIYSGLFTPTEAAAAGALITLIFGWILGSFRSVPIVVSAMKESANTTAMLFLINVGALFYSRVLAVTRIPTELTMFLLNMVKLGYDPIWFGVICLKLTEIGAITPPVGLNVYAMKGVIPKNVNISLEDIFRGIWPFCLCDIVVLVVLIMFPKISTWLPKLLLD